METADNGVERMLSMRRYHKAMREDTKHSVFTTDQLTWNVELGFRGKKLKWFFSTSHENTSQEEAAQIIVGNAEAPFSTLRWTGWYSFILRHKSKYF